MDVLGDILTWLLAAMAISLGIALIGLSIIWQQISRLRVPPDADFFTTLRYVPLSLVILLDLLDFGLDILAAPISWLVLDRLGLTGLRNKAAIEALIPFTQPIPTFTVSWLAARTLDLGEPPRRRRTIDHDEYEEYAPRRRRTIDHDEYEEYAPRPRRRS